MFDLIVRTIEWGGYGGIFLLMVLENIFPPIPSELILPLAGFSAASGDLHIALVILVATLGTVMGVLPWYLLGWWFGIERIHTLATRYGRILTLSSRDVSRAEVWFQKYGYVAVLIGRLIPTIRTLISIPAGVAHMSFKKFLFYSTIGSALWTTILVLLGYILESQYEVVSEYVNVVSNGVVILVVLIYIYRFITFKKESN